MYTYGLVIVMIILMITIETHVCYRDGMIVNH